MRTIKFILAAIFMLLFSASVFWANARETDGNKGVSKTTGYEGDAYRLFINKIDLPMNSRGVLADVEIDGRKGGLFDGKSVIYSSGFWMSGYSNGEIWTNGVASASRNEDYIPGAVDINNPGNYISPGLFVLRSTDPPFGESWQKWAEAVKGGAYFYDGDGDGVYNPVDKNGNGVWDPDEDAPDLLGDETVWCVYNDGLKSADRNFQHVDPQGIDVRQTVWAYATSGDLGNVIFLRYSIVNRGLVSDVLDSVYFSVWADPDLGEYTDDLVGSKPDINAGYVYNDGDDLQFGSNPPTFMIDFFQGPWEYTGDPADTAYNYKGNLLGIDTIVGAKNLGLSSFMHYMQDRNVPLHDPQTKEQARYLLLGRGLDGEQIDPCNWQFGAVLGGVDCNDVDPSFMYSGDPVTMVGWINTNPIDQRQMSNTGPFTLYKDKPVDIVVAYVIGRGESALNSITVTTNIDVSAQGLFDENFIYPSPPPPVQPIVSTEDDAIEIMWNTAKQVTFRDTSGSRFDMHFEGFVVEMFQNGTTAETENGTINKVVIAKYDLANDIKTLYYENTAGEREIIYKDGIQIDSATYADPNTGWLKIRIEQDPFTGGPIIKGKPYFISIRGFALNLKPDMNGIVRMDDRGNYLISRDSWAGYMTNQPTIINDSSSIVGIVPGTDEYEPYFKDVNMEHAQGIATNYVRYSVVNKPAAKENHDYEVGFYIDSLYNGYKLFYYVKDKTDDTVVADSLDNYNAEKGLMEQIDGLTFDVEWKDLEVGAEFSDGGSWAKPFKEDTTGAFYVGKGAPGVPLLFAKNTKVINANNMRRLEIRFGQNGKAYRYTNGSVNGRPTTKFFYGANVDGIGFVDVPFTAWIKDDKYGEERQVAVAIVEDGFDSTGRSDGIWNPGSDLGQTKEYIVVFNSDYSDTPDNLVYTGVPSATSPSKWSRLDGYSMPTNDPNYVVTDSMKFIASQPYFDALAVVGVETVTNDSLFAPTDGVLAVPINYVLTPNDVYNFKVRFNVDQQEGESLFEKVNVYPNPLFAYNSVDSYKYGSKYSPDAPHVTFTNLPNEVTISIYTLSGVKIRELYKNDTNTFLDWNLKNNDGLRAASGMYIAVVHSPKYGDKVLKFAIIMPQKQIQRY